MIERITNGIDAVIEHQKELHRIGVANSAGTIIKRAFPKYYANRRAVAAGEQDHCYPCESDNQVVLAINE